MNHVFFKDKFRILANFSQKLTVLKNTTLFWTIELLLIFENYIWQKIVTQYERLVQCIVTFTFLHRGNIRDVTNFSLTTILQTITRHKKMLLNIWLPSVLAVCP